MGSCVATNIVDDILAKPVVANPKLSNIVEHLYKGTRNPSRVGTGTTADAVQNEILTGQATGGRPGQAAGVAAPEQRWAEYVERVGNEYRERNVSMML